MHATKLVLLATTSSLFLTAAAGRASAAPAWCGPDAEKLQHGDSGDADSAEKTDDPHYALEYVAKGLCNPDTDGRRAEKKFQAVFDKWSKQLALTTGDWTDVVSWAAMETSDQMSTDVKHASFDKRAFATFSPIDQFARIHGDHDAYHLVADMLGAKLSETGRAGYALECLSDDKPVSQAMCDADVTALDEKKVIDELRADKTYPGSARITIRLDMFGARGELAKRAAAIKALKAKDPGYAKLFEIAQATRGDWAAHLAARTSLLELSAAMDDARITHSRKAYAGCEDKTWAAFQTAVAAIPAAKFKDADGELRTAAPIIDTPDGYLAARAIVTCFDGTGQWDGLADAFGEGLEHWPGFRGPRTSIQTAIMLAGIEFDDKDMKLDYPDAGLPLNGAHDEAKGNGYGKGTIAAIKPGAPATIEFKSVMEKSLSCTSWKPSRQIIAITSGGELIRGGGCAAYESITVNSAPKPQAVGSRYVGALKPGMQIFLSKGVPVTASAKGAKVPSVVYGVVVK